MALDCRKAFSANTPKKNPWEYPYPECSVDVLTVWVSLEVTRFRPQQELRRQKKSSRWKADRLWRFHCTFRIQVRFLQLWQPNQSHVLCTNFICAIVYGLYDMPRPIF